MPKNKVTTLVSTAQKVSSHLGASLLASDPCIFSNSLLSSHPWSSQSPQAGMLCGVNFQQQSWGSHLPHKPGESPFGSVSSPGNFWLQPAERALSCSPYSILWFESTVFDVQVRVWAWHWNRDEGFQAITPRHGNCRWLKSSVQFLRLLQRAQISLWCWCERNVKIDFHGVLNNGRDWKSLIAHVKEMCDFSSGAWAMAPFWPTLAITRWKQMKWFISIKFTLFNVVL